MPPVDLTRNTNPKRGAAYWGDCTAWRTSIQKFVWLRKHPSAFITPISPFLTIKDCFDLVFVFAVRLSSISVLCTTDANKYNDDASTMLSMMRARCYQRCEHDAITLMRQTLYASTLIRVVRMRILRVITHHTDHYTDVRHCVIKFWGPRKDRPPGGLSYRYFWGSPSVRRELPGNLLSDLPLLC